MGQQQLLLIVLGVIIVGIAIVVGINLFNANAEESAKDTMASEGTNLAALAQQYYKKPVALGGGGNAFDASNGGQGFAIPPKLVASGIGGAWVATVAANNVSLVGTPDDANYEWTVTVDVFDDSIATTIN
ncbi:MAG: hypothetical protein IPH97_02420 [Ignavibacteriales bacterium]|nr:hypothetical protein [Ignavibacteriales bacterium]